MAENVQHRILIAACGTGTPGYMHVVCRFKQVSLDPQDMEELTLVHSDGKAFLFDCDDGKNIVMGMELFEGQKAAAS
jgi:hypothetical protein